MAYTMKLGNIMLLEKLGLDKEQSLTLEQLDLALSEARKEAYHKARDFRRYADELFDKEIKKYENHGI